MRRDQRIRQEVLEPRWEMARPIEEAEDRQEINITGLITKLKSPKKRAISYLLPTNLGQSRTGQPEIVRFIHTDSGIVPCKDKFLGLPYETNEAILHLTDGKTQSKQFNAIAKRLRINKQISRNFLRECGVQVFAPVICSKVTSNTELASKFIGKTVKPAWQSGFWRATWSGNKSGKRSSRCLDVE